MKTDAIPMDWVPATEVRIAFRDIDMLGHVNNAVFLSFLEQARTDLWWQWFGEGGYRRMPYLVGEACIRYHRPAYLREVLRIDARLVGLSRSTFTLEYRLVRTSDDALIATARTVLVFFAPSTGRATPIPREFRDFAARHGVLADGTSADLESKASVSPSDETSTSC